ncbi:MAG: penicillin acylase family protein [Chloroflexi bacterium]|nr:penicillin acylase family protein [Chloroflexota bacterium]
MTTTISPADCLAITEGETTVAGLDAPVRIVRDRWGIPHIKAESMRDAFFAQGFCIAQDRAFQIDLYRRMARGTSAAMLNAGLLSRDIQNRRLGFGRLAEVEWEQQTDESRTVLQAYADGINAAIATQPRSWEHRVLGLEMAPWSPVDSLAVVKMINVNAQWASKLKFGQVAARLGIEAVRALIPDVPRDAALIVPAGARWTEETHPFLADPESAMGEPDGPIPSGGGSNCWVVHGSRTASGHPMVIGDPHLAISVPAQWYVVHMECPEFVAAGPCNPCYPGPVFYGHNGHVAWTMTHAQGDRWDLYRERIRQGAAGPEALFEDAWAPLTRLDEMFEVRGREPVTRTVWLTRHGPVISGDPTRDDEVIAAHWGLEAPAHDTDALLAVLRARTFEDAREGFRKYDSVSGNFCFAGPSGDIGYQYSGRLPKRPGWVLPVPGWDGKHEWDGDIPKDELPFDENPPGGVILTANNRTIGPDYPHYLSFTSSRWRADRLRELLDEVETFDADTMRLLQGDQTSIHARDLGRRFAGVEVADAGAKRLRGLLEGWDGRLDVDSAIPVAYANICDALIARTVRAYYAQVPNVAASTSAEEYRILYEQLTAGRPLMLMGAASWNVAIAEAMAEASRVIVERHGGDPAVWRWGAEHQVLWAHNLGRDEALAATVNLGLYEAGGDGMTPFATQTERGAASTHGVTYRQIIDLADLNGMKICIPPGNSGQPGSPHYADQLEHWLNVEYHPLYTRWADILASAEHSLELKPA